MIPDHQILSDFTKKCERYLLHIPYSQRLTIFESMKTDLLNEKDQGSYSSLEQVASQYKDLQAFSNSYLKKAGLPLYEKKVNWAKIIVISLIVLFISFFVSLYFFFQSFLPIVEINDRSGSVKLFGGRIDLNDQDFQTKLYINGKEVTPDHLMDRSPEDPNIKGNLGKQYISDFKIMADEIDLNVIAGDFSELSYECLSARVTDDFLKSENQVISLNFEDKAQCKLEIPHEIKLDITASSGFIALKNLKQDFHISLNKGELVWSQDEKSYYGLSQDESFVPDLTWKSSGSSSYRGAVEIEQGVFKIK